MVRIRPTVILPSIALAMLLTSSLELVAQTPLTNGANHSGSIQVGGVDTWTLSAAFNDSITVSVGEVIGGPDVGFYPRLRLLGPDSGSLGDAAGTNSAEISVRATQAGTYTVLVSNNCSGCQTAPGNYTLTVARTSGPYTVSSGDQGGPMTNGANHSGTLAVGDLDPWTIQAAFNESITVSVGEVLGGGPNPEFYPRLRLKGPDGSSIDDDSGTNASEVSVRASQAGTYTVLVSNNCGNCQTATASYVLTVARTSGPYAISAGDQGGPMTNGANHAGTLAVGDLDPWTIQAAFNESITVSIGEVFAGGPNPEFYPRLRLKGPDGAPIDDDSATNAGEVTVRAPQAGTYTVLVSNNCGDCQTATASYVLTVARTSGPYTVSPGDQGGALTNGANHAGTIEIGDLDPWTITAAFNESITISVGEVTGVGPNPEFYPRLRLKGPDGAQVDDDSATNAGEVTVRAPQAGTYTVLVSNNCGDCQLAAASYTLTVARTSGPYTVSPGDQGGPMTNAASHPGLIHVGDLDTWTFLAAAGDNISLSLGEVLDGGNPDPELYPRLRLKAPDGASLGDQSGTNAAQMGVVATQTGPYTVLVSNNCGDCQTGVGTYGLTVSGLTPFHALTVQGGGTGHGVVTGNGIGCTISLGSAVGTCSVSHPAGTVVSLTAAPGTGSKLGGWGGACAGTGVCQTTMSAPRVVTATLVMPGDCNGDGQVSVADVFHLINYLFAGGPAPVGPADVNSDLTVSVGDVFYLINFLFAGGPAPVGPGDVNNDLPVSVGDVFYLINPLLGGAE